MAISNLLNLPSPSLSATGRIDSSPGQQQSVTPKPGTLFIRDSFLTPALGNVPHGEMVRRAASQQGFRGPVVGYQQPMSSNSGQLLEANSAVTLQTRELTKEEALKALTDRTRGAVIGTLDSQSQYLRSLQQQGVKNSAVNLSWGVSKASLSLDQYEQTYQSVGFGTANRTLENYARAFDLDMNRLNSSDQTVRERETHKLLQNLVNHNSHVIDTDSTVKQSKKNWETAVKSFESQKNSVVVSAGNEGGAKKAMESFSRQGLHLKTPQDFERNALETDEVTTVGATRWFEKQSNLTEKRANYSSHSSGVDVYASGSLSLNGTNRADTHGTSFSAPRVSATMATLHKENPTLSSEQVERLMREKFTHQLDGGKNQLTVLDHKKTYNFLQSQTF